MSRLLSSGADETDTISRKVLITALSLSASLSCKQQSSELYFLWSKYGREVPSTISLEGD
jgi:hypothetical protein